MKLTHYILQELESQLRIMENSVQDTLLFCQQTSTTDWGGPDLKSDAIEAASKAKEDSDEAIRELRLLTKTAEGVKKLIASRQAAALQASASSIPTKRVKRESEERSESLPSHSAKRRRVEEWILDPVERNKEGILEEVIKEQRTNEQEMNLPESARNTRNQNTEGSSPVNRVKRDSEDPSERLQSHTAKRRRVDRPEREAIERNTFVTMNVPDTVAEANVRMQQNPDPTETARGTVGPSRRASGPMKGAKREPEVLPGTIQTDSEKEANLRRGIATLLEFMEKNNPGQGRQIMEADGAPLDLPKDGDSSFAVDYAAEVERRVAAGERRRKANMTNELNEGIKRKRDAGGVEETLGTGRPSKRLQTNTGHVV